MCILTLLGLRCCFSLAGSSLVVASASWLWCVGISLWWLLLLWSTGSRLQAQLLWLSYSMACGIFPDQGSNPCLLHWWWVLYH